MINRREIEYAEVESRVYAAEIPLVSQKPMKIHLEEENAASVSLAGYQATISIDSRMCDDLFVHHQSCTSVMYQTHIKRIETVEHRTLCLMPITRLPMKILAVQINDLSLIRKGIITLVIEREPLFGAFVF